MPFVMTLKFHLLEIEYTSLPFDFGDICVASFNQMDVKNITQAGG